MSAFNFKYAKGRQCYIDGISPEVIDDCFKTLLDVFDEKWLNANGDNIMQRLWAAKYNLATIELYALGAAIKNLLVIDKKFIQDKVALIKTNDPKNWNGAFFEIFALNTFLYHNNVIPAPENQAGYDGTIQFKNGRSIRLSVKNYSISVHQGNFLKECELVKDLVEKYLQQYKCPSLEIIIHKSIGYPSAEDWKVLKDNLHGVFIEYVKAGKNWVSFNMPNDWAFNVQGLKSFEPFSGAKKSYTLIVSSNFHKNEEKNLFDKLEDACANLAKHEKTETEYVKNVIIIHLPRIASRKNCEQWVKDYFNQFPEKPISGVILLQPLRIKDEKKGQYYISVGTSMVFREQFTKDFNDVIPIDMVYPVGRFEGNYPVHKIMIQRTDSTAIEMIMENCYIYQQGHHYHDMKMTANGIAEGRVAKVASGIFSHSVLNILGIPIMLSGIIEPVDILEIM